MAESGINWAFKVQDWVFNSFFIKLYIKNEEIEQQEDKMQLIWSFLYKTLLARQAFEDEMYVDYDQLEEEVNKLLEEENIGHALDSEHISSEDLRMFLTIEYLHEKEMSRIEEIVKKDVGANPKLVEQLYHENNNLNILNAREIKEVFINKPDFVFDSEKIYTEEELGKISSMKPLDYFSEDEIKRLEEHSSYKILDKKAGNLIEIFPPDSEEKLYYYIKAIHSEHKKDFASVKEEFEDFIYEYTLEETIEEICQKLMDKFDIEYNETFLDYYLKE